MKTIGKGIVGSQDEEQGRQDLTSWKQGDVYLVPSNGGKAVAWIHSKLSPSTGNDSGNEENASSNPTSPSATKNNPPVATSSGGHAIVYVCKIPQESLDNTQKEVSDNNNDDDIPDWRRLVHSICHKGLASFENENTGKENGLRYQKVSEESSVRLREAIATLS